MTHGLSGSGVVVGSADVAAVERLKGAFERELAPRGAMAVELVHRAAVLSNRLVRCGRQEVAATAERVGRAEADFDDGRLDEVDRLMEALAEAPGASLRRLERMPEGVDRLVGAWLGLREELEGGEARWGEEHRTLAEALTGRRRGEFGTSTIGKLSEVLGDAEGSAEAKDRARSGLLAVIDEAVARLLEGRKGIDLGAIADSRAGAAARALFDTSKEATLARRYEAATERGLFRTFRELETLRGRPELDERPAASPTTTAVISEEVEATLRQLARAEAAVAEVEAQTADRAALGSFGAETVEAPSPPRDPAERARRPDPAKLKRALKDERRGSRGDLRARTAGGR